MITSKNMKITYFDVLSQFMNKTFQMYSKSLADQL